jgi:hypothetical protein
MSASGYVHLEVDEIKKETDKAFLVVVDDEEVWLPKSQIANPGDYNKGDKNCSISVREWLAKEKGFDV